MEWLNIFFSELSETFTFCFIEEDRYLLLLKGLGVTIKISIVSAILSIIIGFIIACCSLSKNKALNCTARVYTDIIRGTPAVTQLMIIYFIVFASVNWEKWIIASIAFAINSGAYLSESIRAGILSVDQGQIEAGRALGFSPSMTLFLIVVPQAVTNIFPAICNEFITLIKETAIVGYVGLMDIQKAGDFIKSATYEAFMPLIGTAVIYFIIIKTLTYFFHKCEKRLRRYESK